MHPPTRIKKGFDFFVSFFWIIFFVFDKKRAYRNFLHHVGTSYALKPNRPSTLWRKKTKTSDNHRNFLHIYFGLAERLLSEQTQNFRWGSELPTLGRNFRSTLSSRACKMHRKLQKNIKLILLASYLRALYDTTMKCIVWQFFLYSFTHVR